MHAKLGDDSTKLQGEILYRLFLGVGGSTCIKFGKDAGELGAPNATSHISDMMQIALIRLLSKIEANCRTF